MTHPVPGPHHIGYWVADIEEAAERAHRALGIGPFHVHPHVAFDSFVLADGTAVSDPAYFDHSSAFAAWGPTIIELGQVHSAHPDIVAAYGIRTGTISHVSWVADDLEAESARLAALGCALIHTASTGAIAVAWHDGGPLFGHPVEVHRAGPAILGMRDRLSSAAAGWDGSQIVRPMNPAIRRVGPPAAGPGLATQSRLPSHDNDFR